MLPQILRIYSTVVDGHLAVFEAHQVCKCRLYSPFDFILAILGGWDCRLGFCIGVWPFFTRFHVIDLTGLTIFVLDHFGFWVVLRLAGSLIAFRLRVGLDDLLIVGFHSDPMMVKCVLQLMCISYGLSLGVSVLHECSIVFMEDIYHCRYALRLTIVY